MNVEYTAVQDLCEMQDLHNLELFDTTKIEQFIQYFCTNFFLCILYIYEMQILYTYMCVYILYLYCNCVLVVHNCI